MVAFTASKLAVSALAGSAIVSALPFADKHAPSHSKHIVNVHAHKRSADIKPVDVEVNYHPKDIKRQMNNKPTMPTPASMPMPMIAENGKHNHVDNNKGDGRPAPEMKHNKSNKGQEMSVPGPANGKMVKMNGHKQPFKNNGQSDRHSGNDEKRALVDVKYTDGKASKVS